MLDSASRPSPALQFTCVERLNYYSFSIPHESLVPADKVALTEHEAEEALDACLRRLAVEDAANAAAAGGKPLVVAGAVLAGDHSTGGSGSSHDAPHLSIRVPPPANPRAAGAVPVKAADKAAAHAQAQSHPRTVPTAAAVAAAAAAAAAAKKEAELLHYRSHDRVYDGWHPRFFNAALARRHWPVRGEIIFRDVSLRYREGLPLVLRNVNLRIQPGHTVGVVGRTGAGKT